MSTAGAGAGAGGSAPTATGFSAADSGEADEWIAAALAHADDDVDVGGDAGAPFSTLVSFLSHAFTYATTSIPKSVEPGSFREHASRFLRKAHLTHADVRPLYLKSGVNWDSFQLEKWPGATPDLKGKGHLEVLMAAVRADIVTANPGLVNSIRARHPYLTDADTDRVAQLVYAEGRARFFKLVAEVVVGACQPAPYADVDDAALVSDLEAVIVMRAHFHIFLTLMLAEDTAAMGTLVQDLRQRADEAVESWCATWPAVIAACNKTCSRLVKDADRLRADLKQHLETTDASFQVRTQVLASRDTAIAAARKDATKVRVLHESSSGRCASLCALARLMKRRALYVGLLVVEIVVIVFVVLKLVA